MTADQARDHIAGTGLELPRRVGGRTSAQRYRPARAANDNRRPPLAWLGGRAGMVVLALAAFSLLCFAAGLLA